MSSETFSYVRGWKREFESKGWWHSFDLPGGRHIEGVCPVEGLRKRIEQTPIPQDLRGARVLDIGAWDGWYTFEMERRGADVLAVDCFDNPRFHEIRAALKSRVEYRQLDVYELTPDTVGRFDIVLFMGVLYHLKHPLLALERVCAITKDLAVVDSFVIREQHRPGENLDGRPLMGFYETEELGGQSDNWCGPNLACLLAMCRTAGFARVEHRATLPDGASIACYRKWAPVSETSQPAPQLLDARHHTNFGINFQSKYDEYILATFEHPARSLQLDEIQPQVGEYGVRPIHVSSLASGVWQVSFKLPPGLPAGWHEVTVRAGAGGASNSRQIALDIPLPDARVQILAVSDGTTWAPGVVEMNRGNALTIWVAGLPGNADRANVRVLLGGEIVPVSFVGPGAATATRQVNVLVPHGAPAGFFEVEIEAGSARSEAMAVRIER